MKIIQFFFLFVICTISLIGQDIPLVQPIETVYQLYKTEQFQAALESSDKYIVTLDTLQDKEIYEAFLSLKGNILRQMGQSALAIRFHTKALLLREEIYGKKSLEASRSLFNIGNCYLDEGLYEQALVFLLAAKNSKASQALTETGLINVYNSLAFCYQQLHQDKAAKQYIHQAINVASDVYGQNSTQLIFPLNTLANLLLAENHPDSAAFYLNRALKIQQDSIGQLHSTTVLLKNNLARSFGESGRYTLAIDLLQESLLLYQQIGAANPKIQADCFLNLGNYYLDKGENDLGLEYLSRANSTYDKIEDWAASRNSMGLAYRYLGQTDKAISQLSMTISEVPDSIIKGKLGLIMADIYINLGSSYLDKQAYDAAQYFLQKGQQVYIKEKGMELVPATIDNKLGQCFLGLQQYESATQQFNLALQKTQGFRQFGSLYYLGVVREAQNRPKQALVFYETALQKLGETAIRKDTPFPFETIQVYEKLTAWWLKKAKKSQGMKDWEKALLYANKGIHVLETLKGTIKEYNSEIDLQNTFYQIYNYAIESALALNKSKEAFSLAEKYKSNVLKRVAKYTSDKHHFNLPKPLLVEEARIKEGLTFYKKKRFALERQILSNTEEQQLKLVKDSIGLLLDAKAQWQKQVAKKAPNYFQLMEQDSSIRIESIQEGLKANQTLIEFQWSDHQLLTFLLTKDTFLVFQQVNTQALKTAITKFNFLSQNQPDLSGEKLMVDAENFVQLASFLYQQLILPIKPFIKEELIIIPDSWLYFLPFECLIKAKSKAAYHFRSHQYLVQDVAISYDFAATLAIKKDYKSQAFKKNLLIVAPSFVNNSRQLKELAYSKEEVEGVASILKADIWMDEDALEEKFVQAASNYQILHIASHGIMNNQYPDYSFVAFTEQKDSIENEVLYVSEIYNIPINADLVILSACQTAGGKLYRGEGLLSIAHAFMYAGAKSIIASLWNVDDEQTPALMKGFYAALKSGLTKPKAIQQAKIDNLKTADHFKAHPYYWAGFMVIGNTQALEIAPTNNWGFYTMSLLGIFLVSMLVFRWRKKINSKHKLI